MGGDLVKPSSALSLFLLMVACSFVAIWFDEHRVLRNLDQGQRDALYTFQSRMESLRPGDFVVLDGETYLLKSLESEYCILRLEGPGPQSNPKPKIISFNPNRLQECLDFSHRVSRTIKKGESGWDEIREWYFLP